MSRWDIKYSPYVLVAPFFILFGIFGLFPILYTAYTSLFRWTLLDGGNHQFVGLANYQRVLTDDRFWNAVFNTVGMFILATVPQLLLALVIANLLNRRLRARTVLRMGILIPNITSVLAVGIVFGLIFADRYGLINWLLDLVGLVGGRHDGRLAVDRLQRADLPRRHAGDPAGPVRVGRH